MTNLEAAEQVLRDVGTPLRYDEIATRAISAGMIIPQGQTPAATMSAQISMSIARQGTDSLFVRTAPATFALRAWIKEGRIAEPDIVSGEDVRIAAFPEYDAVRSLLPVLQGTPRTLMTGLRAAIWEQTGTFEDNVDWTEPDRWIPERLTGEYREAAQKVWTATNHRVNPRHMTGHWHLATGYDLVVEGADGRLEESERGREFREHSNGVVVREIDEREGLIKLLALVAERGPASSGDLLQPWIEYAHRVSRIRAESTARSFLYYRLRNLTGRSLVTRAGLKYQATAAGLAHLQGSGLSELGAPSPTETAKLLELVVSQRAAVRNALHNRLSETDPYAFEHVIKHLLEEMGYTDVEVTARSGDKGVDVLAQIVVGITEVREVVQVKRQRGNVWSCPGSVDGSRLGIQAASWVDDVRRS
ncbi:MAG: HTH domain-containing protein [Gemmatimonadota bacterium]|nr:HTH domain-containing protein [Gemmatimonadota bacterium]